MNRRQALKNIGWISGGVILLPSCDFSDEKVSIILNKLQISVKEEKLLKEIVGTIIPEGKIPGAKTLKADNFVWVMVDDCLPDIKQNSFMKGLKLFEKHHSSFVELNGKERLATLNEILNLTDQNKDQKKMKHFIKSVKYYASWGYMQSEYIMTKVMPYELVPGKYGSCETIETGKRVNING